MTEPLQTKKIEDGERRQEEGLPNDSLDVINKVQDNKSCSTPKREKRKNYVVSGQKLEIEKMRRRFDKRFLLQNVFQSKYFSQANVFLTALYAVLMFGQFSLDDSSQEQKQFITTSLSVLQYLEIVLISLFVLEIILKAYAYGTKTYLKEKMNLVDAIVILLSLLLVILTPMIVNKSLQLLSKFLRTMFRFLRLFIILRKVKDINQNFLESQKLSNQTPVEQILGIIDDLKQIVTESTYLRELEWQFIELMSFIAITLLRAAKMISSNKLYEPMIVGKEQKELLKWIEQYDGNQTSKPVTQKTISISTAQNNNSNKQNVNNKSKEEVLPAQEKTIQEFPLKPNFSYEKMNLPSKALVYFNHSDSLEFSTFEFFKEGFGNELALFLNYLFDSYSCFSAWRLLPSTLFKYQNNRYHNAMHAFDVTQTMFFFLKKCGFERIGKLNKIDIGTSFIACAIHDVDHPGFNNPFQINGRTQLALIYNDKSPLENHHLSTTFRLLRDNNQINIFSGLTKKEVISIRQNLIEMVLKTDMAFHFQGIAQLKGRQATNEFNSSGADKILSLTSLLHAADVSNPFKPFFIYQEWSERILDEFWQQGDEERKLGLPISYLCDRYETNLAKSQLGFIDFIVRPLFEQISQFIPELKHYMGVFETNKQEWQVYEDYYDRKLKSLVQQREKDQQNQDNQQRQDPSF